MKEVLKRARLKNGHQGVHFYEKGLIGKSTEINKVGNVMFYPDNMEPCYRVCLDANLIEFID